MAKAWLNNVVEEGSRQELVRWLVELDKENDALRAQLALYDKLKDMKDEWQKLHGERVEARQNR